MNDYVEVRVDMIPCSEDMTDVMAAVLADAGFESFVADADGLTAYIRKDDYLDSMAELVNEMPFHCQAKWTAKVIEGRDWNSEWEKNYFKPIVVGDRVAIHSSFHTDVPVCEYDIV
ncbi:MAG: 50S ribosomal protein L11 methyltransferase, partial [Paramuribaculum sp.]|nr:50S ribosomal protein L11 methyltransferase [Paramuribaculum sp.]